MTASPAPATPPDAGRALRDALSAFATGVTIVTARAPDGQAVGLTVNSFNSVSLAPPLVLFSLARQVRSLAVFTAPGAHFAVHVLAAAQMALAERFASRVGDRWAGVAHHAGAQGVPLIEGALAVFECRLHASHAAGDHVILVGEVLAARHHAGAPLLFHGGRFHTDHAIGTAERFDPLRT